MKILHIDSSILGDYSVSRQLSADIVARLRELHPGSEIVYRDLVEDAVGHLSGAYMAVVRGGGNPDPQLSDEIAHGDAYINDLFAAEIIVIGAPMYNFTVPSQLKAWIDRVVIGGRTFIYGPNGPQGLIQKGKRLFIVSTRGGTYSGDSTTAVLDHHETYLKAVLGFIGLTDVTVIRAEGLGQGNEETKSAIISQAKLSIASLEA
ncbi:FMN-dependent NADH-azoreductase [Pectobacterium punjabense]|uniref:FMN-dependent NADH-azoreductase n=1 Tax=Pectobacterium punjabense TaxID=2108399 RepID=UPI001BFF172B|nr:FMN-dependent NADH-azoreductase [Pectobacterium punjabense]MBT9186251.1 FMN-dependent NADH-azoreductase [Pectobacterium punjabense]